MRWLSNISFSSSASSSSSSSSSGKSRWRKISGRGGAGSEDQICRGGGWRCSIRKCSCQRKLRSSDPESSRSSFSNPSELIPPSQSPKKFDLAVPLPLPELSSTSRSKDGLSSNGTSPLPSPKDGPGKSQEERYRDRDPVGAPFKIGDGTLSNIRVKSVFTCKERRVEKDEEGTSLRGIRQDQDNLKAGIETWSTPSSPFARSLSHCYYVIPNKNEVWSAPELSPSPVIPGTIPPSFYDHPTSFRTSTSPIQSPSIISPRQDTRSSTRPSSPLHPRLSVDIPTLLCKNNGQFYVCRLPLPPGASSHSTSAPISPRQEPISMKNQWQKGKLIGRGTFGSVYVASNRATGALCAMKEVELVPDDPKSAECIKQLEQEIKVLSQLKHPNIVQYYGSEIVDDRFLIYLEYVHPGSISIYVREHCGAITECVIRNFTRHILSGLAYLHSTKTLHRDIKGANLLVDSSGVVKLSDFGMAKHLTGQAGSLSLKGSPYWMAPELMQAVRQKDDNSELALAVDIWSLGCTIIEMFTGKPPWSEYEGAAAMFKVMRDTPSIPDSLSCEGKDFLRCCFQRNPADRPSALILLEHRFLKMSLPLDVPSPS